MVVLRPFKTCVVEEICYAASLYQKHLIDFDYLIYNPDFTKPHFLRAELDNFAHLTGVNHLINSRDFFTKALIGTLSESDFDFNKGGYSLKSVKSSVKKKLKAFEDLPKIFAPGVMVEEGFQKNRLRCALGAATSSLTIGFTYGTKCRPMSLLEGMELCNPVSLHIMLKKPRKSCVFDEILIGSVSKVQNLMRDPKLISDKILSVTDK